MSFKQVNVLTRINLRGLGWVFEQEVAALKKVQSRIARIVSGLKTFASKDSETGWEPLSCGR